MMTTAIGIPTYVLQFLISNCYGSYMYPCYLRNGSRVSTAAHVPYMYYAYTKEVHAEEVAAVSRQYRPATIMGFP